MVAEPEPWAIWSPVGLGISEAFVALGLTPETANAIRANNWWLHAVLALAFTAAIPWYKAKHMLTVLVSLSVRDGKALKRLPLDTEDRDHSGYRDMSDFTWKNMLHLDACTKCGRCHEACPAANSHFPLSPRDLILDLCEHNEQVRGGAGVGPLVGNVLEPETLWSCLTCGACQEICPVGIEHPAMIVQLRRNLVEAGNLDPMLQGTLDAFSKTGNSFGENARGRAAWTEGLEFKVKDIREEAADYLWFVGDYAAFDPRNQQVSRIVARLLKIAGVDFGLLFEAERNAGNDVRRVGEEGLFESLARHNVEQLASCKPFKRILTTDPHSYNTLKNEYPDLGLEMEVVHYSELLEQLLLDGRLTVSKPLSRTLTYHDPCHLGRLNGVYDAPRNVLKLIGCGLVEMPRSRDNSFCCGAGGGRIWMPDPPGQEKPSENRMREAVGLLVVDTFVTCCPKDLTMFEDARKTSGSEDRIVVSDIAELVAEAIELDQLKLEDVPDLVARIAEISAARVASAVQARLDAVFGEVSGATVSPSSPAPIVADAIVHLTSPARGKKTPSRLDRRWRRHLQKWSCPGRPLPCARFWSR